jgi:hypothetical protein
MKKDPKNRSECLVRSKHWLKVLMVSLVAFSCSKETIEPVVNGKFLSFETSGQTLPTTINVEENKIKFEVDHDVDLTTLVPEFNLPEGYTLYLNGAQQFSGSSLVDFTQPVTYEVRAKNHATTTWQAEAVQLSCKILIDASKDGGVWWFPQSPATGFNPDEYHQGQAFADHLREKGFDVTELPRGVELTEELFYGYYIVIRTSGFFGYTPKELMVYSKLLERGMNLVFFTDHKKYDPQDELGDFLGLKFEGIAHGYVEDFATHTITENLTSLHYNAGSVITNANTNPNIEVLGRLRETDYADLNFNNIQDIGEPVASPVMGILHYDHSRVFFIGDLNGLEVRPQPFIDNLITWMGTCFQH